MSEAIRQAVARAIWNIRREDEDRCDMELEDMGEGHSVWREAEAALAALSAEQPKPVAWEGAEEWEPLAFALCEEETGDPHHLIWEGYPPEPWGEAWQRYEPEAKRMIAMVRKYASPLAAPASQPDAAAIRRKALELLSDDAYAASFQSIGQYRSALIRALEAPQEQQEQDGTCVKCPRDPHKVCDYCGLQQAGQPAPAVPEGFVLVPTDLNSVVNMGWVYLDKAREESPLKEWAFSPAGFIAAITAAPAQEGNQK